MKPWVRLVGRLLVIVGGLLPLVAGYTQGVIIQATYVLVIALLLLQYGEEK